MSSKKQVDALEVKVDLEAEFLKAVVAKVKVKAQKLDQLQLFPCQALYLALRHRTSVDRGAGSEINETLRKWCARIAYVVKNDKDSFSTQAVWLANGSTLNWLIDNDVHLQSDDALADTAKLAARHLLEIVDSELPDCINSMVTESSFGTKNPAIEKLNGILTALKKCRLHQDLVNQLLLQLLYSVHARLLRALFVKSEEPSVRVVDRLKTRTKELLDWARETGLDFSPEHSSCVQLRQALDLWTVLSSHPKDVVSAATEACGDLSSSQVHSLLKAFQAPSEDSVVGVQVWNEIASRRAEHEPASSSRFKFEDVSLPANEYDYLNCTEFFWSDFFKSLTKKELCRKVRVQRSAGNKAPVVKNAQPAANTSSWKKTKRSRSTDSGGSSNPEPRKKVQRSSVDQRDASETADSKSVAPSTSGAGPSPSSTDTKTTRRHSSTSDKDSSNKQKPRKKVQRSNVNQRNVNETADSKSAKQTQPKAGPSSSSSDTKSTLRFSSTSNKDSSSKPVQRSSVDQRDASETAVMYSKSVAPSTSGAGPSPSSSDTKTTRRHSSTSNDEKEPIVRKDRPVTSSEKRATGEEQQQQSATSSNSSNALPVALKNDDPKNVECSACKKKITKRNFNRHLRDVHDIMSTVKSRKSKSNQSECPACGRPKHETAGDTCPLDSDKVKSLKDCLNHIVKVREITNKFKQRKMERRGVFKCGFDKLVASEPVRAEICDAVQVLSRMAIKVSFLIEYCARDPKKHLLDYLKNCDKEPSFMLFFNFLKDKAPQQRKNPNKLEQENPVDVLRQKMEPLVAKFLEKCAEEKTYDCERRAALVANLEVTYRRCLATNVKTHMRQRLRKYLKTKNITNYKKQNEILKDLFANNDTSRLPGLDELLAGDRVDFRNKKKWWLFVNFFYRLNAYFASTEETKSKCFVVFPIFGFGVKNVEYTSEAVHEMCAKLYPKSTGERPTMSKNQDSLIKEWYRCFKLEEVLKRKGVGDFGFNVTTNGVSASVHYRKKRESVEHPDEDEEEEEEEDPDETYWEKVERKEREQLRGKTFNRYVGIDPGLRIALGCYIVSSDDFDPQEAHESYRLFSRSFWHCTGKWKREKRRERMLRDVKQWEQTDLKEGYPDINLKLHDTYETATEYRLTNFKMRQSVVEKRAYTLLHWEHYQEVDRKIDKAWDFICYGNSKGSDRRKTKTYVALGQCKISGYMRGYERAPLKKFEKRIRQKMSDDPNIFVSNTKEYNTTALCCKCNRLQYVSENGHRYVYCKSCKLTCNRDICAAKNILLTSLVSRDLRRPDFMRDFDNFARQGQQRL